MARQIASPDEAERKRLFDEVQKIFAEHLPIVYFVAPRIYVAHVVARDQPDARRIAPQLLWRPETRWPSVRLTRYLARRLAFAAVPGRSPCRRRRWCWRGWRRATTSPSRSAREAQPRDDRTERARATASTSRSPRSTSTGWPRAARLDFGRSLQYDRPVARPDPRARGQHRHPRGHRARRRHARRPAARRRHRQPPRRRAARRDPRGVDRAAVDAAAADVAVAGVHRRAHRLAADRRHALGERAGRAARRSICCATWSCPAAALALPLAAMLERLQAQAMSEVIGEPFVLAALARGVPRSRIVWRDALKAALRPVAAVYGLIVGTLLSGSFAVEVITAWPGLGSLMLAGAAGARRLSGRRLRRRRRAVSRVRHAAVGRRARRLSIRARVNRGEQDDSRLGVALVAVALLAALAAPAGRAACRLTRIRRPAQRAADGVRIVDDRRLAGARRSSTLAARQPARTALRRGSLSGGSAVEQMKNGSARAQATYCSGDPAERQRVRRRRRDPRTRDGHRRRDQRLLRVPRGRRRHHDDANRRQRTGRRVRRRAGWRAAEPLTTRTT